MQDMCVLQNSLFLSKTSRQAKNNIIVMRGHCDKTAATVCTVQQWRTKELCSTEGGGSTNSVADGGRRERGSGGGSPLVSGSGGSCKLVQGISFHIIKFS